MKDIIKVIKEDTKFNQEVLDEKIEQSLAANQKVVSLQDKFPQVLVQLREKLDQGYSLEPMHSLNIQRQGFCSFALQKPEHILKEEAAVIVAQTKENYEASLTRLRDRLIVDAIETELEAQREKEVEKLRQKEQTEKQKIKEKLLAALS